jgi:hypothetical protein
VPEALNLAEAIVLAVVRKIAEAKPRVFFSPNKGVGLRHAISGFDRLIVHLASHGGEHGLLPPNSDKV